MMLDSRLAGRRAVSSAVAGVRTGRGQSAAPWWSVGRRLDAADGRLPVEPRDRADRLRQHRLAVAPAGAARSAAQPHARRLRRGVHVRRDTAERLSGTVLPATGLLCYISRES